MNVVHIDTACRTRRQCLHRVTQRLARSRKFRSLGRAFPIGSTVDLQLIGVE